MEDGYGTIIYIVITIIALIITALGKKKKQTPRAPLREEPEIAVTDPFEAFEFEEKEQETTIAEEKEEIPEEKPVMVNELGMIIEEGVSALKDKKSLSDTELEEMKKDMLTDDEDRISFVDPTSPYEEKLEESELNEIMKDFDLKKAVIFSEILTRREF
ncbi:MAG: hypothetical protein JSV24_01015 [Bacteroidales bacterium]|nr:MAG: hypothetical protein JSV24_01015 [Bacteroidales bacterium]